MSERPVNGPIPGLRKRFSQTSIHVRAPSGFGAFLTRRVG
jgi:hypothetical protein